MEEEDGRKRGGVGVYSRESWEKKFGEREREPALEWVFFPYVIYCTLCMLAGYVSRAL